MIQREVFHIGVRAGLRTQELNVSLAMGANRASRIFESISVWGHKNESGELPPPAIIHPLGAPEVVGA